MIETGTYDNYGNEHEFITINLADKKHQNRVIDFLEGFNLINEKHEYTIRAKWTQSKFHPDMVMTEDDFLDFSNAVNELAKKLQDRRNNKKP